MSGNQAECRYISITLDRKLEAVEKYEELKENPGALGRRIRSLKYKIDTWDRIWEPMNK